jgi:type I restriction enzyme S subunit
MHDDWIEISLEDLETSGVVKLGRGEVISKKDMEANPGPNPVYSSAENKNGMIGKYAKFMFDEELITWSIDGGGHIFYRPKHKFSVTNIGGWLRILDGKVFSYQFLTYALQRLHKQHSFDWQHKAHPSVIRKLYTRIPLPSLPEQERIVDLISSVDSYIESLQQQLETAKRSRNAVLHELLNTGGDDWVETTLGEVAEVIDPHPSHRAPAVDDDGIPFIGIGDLRKTGDIDFAKARRVSREILEEHKARYNRSEFLIGLGRVASIGMVVRLPDESIEYVVSPTLAVIKPKDVLGQFLFYSLEGPHSQEQFQRFKKGSTRESVGMQILRKIKVHIPPLPEQKRIVEIIKSIDEVLNTTSCALSESKKLRSGLLSDLLSGEHEIPASYDKVIGAA